jgi:hypothetical protein
MSPGGSNPPSSARSSPRSRRAGESSGGLPPIFRGLSSTRFTPTASGLGSPWPSRRDIALAAPLGVPVLGVAASDPDDGIRLRWCRPELDHVPVDDAVGELLRVALVPPGGRHPHAVLTRWNLWPTTNTSSARYGLTKGSTLSRWVSGLDDLRSDVAQHARCDVRAAALFPD